MAQISSSQKSQDQAANDSGSFASLTADLLSRSRHGVITRPGAKIYAHKPALWKPSQEQNEGRVQPDRAAAQSGDDGLMARHPAGAAENSFAASAQRDSSVGASAVLSSGDGANAGGAFPDAQYAPRFTASDYSPPMIAVTFRMDWRSFERLHRGAAQLGMAPRDVVRRAIHEFLGARGVAPNPGK